MKKRLFSYCTSALLLLAISFLINTQLTAGILDTLRGLLALESFEGDTFPPEGWSKITQFDAEGWTSGQVGETILGMEFFGPVPEEAPGGEQMFAYASWATGDADTNFTTDQRTDQWLITPQIVGIEVGDSLKFSVKTFGEFPEQIDVLISTTGADSMRYFDTTLVFLTFDGTSGTEWQKKSVDLSAFADSSIYIAFREHVSATFAQGDAVLLDLVEVTSMVTSVQQRNRAVSGFALSQNYPNPFNPATQIRFTIPEAASVSLKVFNLTGQEVATLANGKNYQAGTHAFQFNASHLPNGLYYYRIEAGNFVDVRKMTLLK